jgi:hypothetical protein
MYKLFAIFLIAVLCFSLVGCSDDTAEQTSSVVTYYDGQSESVIKKDDIANQVQNGTITVSYENIDEMHRSGNVQLKMSSDDMKAALPESDLLRSESEKYIQYTIGGADFYYTNDDNAPDKTVNIDFGRAGTYEVYYLDNSHDPNVKVISTTTKFTLPRCGSVLIKEI